MMYIVAFFIWVMALINVNGSYFTDDQPVFLSANRSYRYGDGLFETIKIVNRTIALEELHFNRFFNGLKVLEYNIPNSVSKEWLKNEIIKLCDKNDLVNARIRLSVWGGEGPIDKEERPFNYLIECSPLHYVSRTWSEIGLHIGVFKNGRKSIDAYANLKSASFLIYSLAAKKALNNKWDDCIVLSTNETIADTTKANIFSIKDENIYTPPLTDGCVAGVTRQYLLQNLSDDFLINEKSLTTKDIEQADEVFITNAIRGIQWVHQFNDAVYANNLTREINDHFLLKYNKDLSNREK